MDVFSVLKRPLNKVCLGIFLCIQLPIATSAWANQQAVHTGKCLNMCELFPVLQGEADLQHTAEANSDIAVFPMVVAEGVVPRASRFINNKNLTTASAENIAVIYPDIGEPFRSVFAQIINGIEAKAKGRVANIPIASNMSVGALNNSLRSQDTKVVIALGQQGLKIASGLDSQFGVVVGGVFSGLGNESKNLKVNSLSPDPLLLFARLKQLMPQVKRILTVYDPKQNDWMVRLAKEAARKYGIEFVSYEAKDIRSAVHIYQEIFSTADIKQDALWLMQDTTTVDESAVLPYVLQESWVRNLAIFSSNYGHVKRGALFSMYPNNTGLGQQLADSAINYLTSGGDGIPNTVPLREVLVAVNLRTAKHLGLNEIQPAGFDMVFPER